MQIRARIGCLMLGAVIGGAIGQQFLHTESSSRQGRVAKSHHDRWKPFWILGASIAAGALAACGSAKLISRTVRREIFIRRESGHEDELHP